MGFNTRRLRHLEFQPYPGRHHLLSQRQSLFRCHVHDPVLEAAFGNVPVLISALPTFWRQDQAPPSLPPTRPKLGPICLLLGAPSTVSLLFAEEPKNREEPGGPEEPGDHFLSAPPPPPVRLRCWYTRSVIRVGRYARPYRTSRRIRRQHSRSRRDRPRNEPVSAQPHPRPLPLPVSARGRKGVSSPTVINTRQEVASRLSRASRSLVLSRWRCANLPFVHHHRRERQSLGKLM